jgi:nicotinamide-nucleotide amidase
VVIVFGGLGPTSDDLTAEAVTRLAGGSLVQHEPSYLRLVDFYNKRQREVTSAALKQVLVPSIAEVYLNEVGMAPAFSFRFEKAVFYCLPGVPREMKWLFEKYVLPAILPSESEILTRTWACLGIWESDL